LTEKELGGKWDDTILSSMFQIVPPAKPTKKTQKIMGTDKNNHPTKFLPIKSLRPK